MHSLYDTLTAEQINTKLDTILSLVLFQSRDLKTISLQLAACSRAQQDWVVESTKLLAQHNLEVAYQFSQHVPTALQLMNMEGAELWLQDTLLLYDSQGLHVAVQHIQEVKPFATEYQQNLNAVKLQDIHGILHYFVTGLNGRQLDITAGNEIFTDTQTIFLPAQLNYFSHIQDNTQLYKAMLSHLWAQTWFGTWQLNIKTACQQFNWCDKVIRLFHVLERLRLDACLDRELPGLARQMRTLLAVAQQPEIPKGWEYIAHELSQPDASVETSYELLDTVYTWAIPDPVCYQGVLRPDIVEQVKNQRRSQDKHHFQQALNQLLQQHKKTDSQIGDNDKPQFSVQESDVYDAQSKHSPILTLDGQPMPVDEETKKVMLSIIQDEGGIPQEYLIPAGNTGNEFSGKVEISEVELKTVHFIYPEWDYLRQTYRQNWCYVEEVEPQLSDEQFVYDTLQEHHGLLKTLRRNFEALRGGRHWSKRQVDGEEVDIDALVQAQVDLVTGQEMPEQLFLKLRRLERDIAVMFMVDMSGSTKGWVNLAERQSLILLSEVLEKLGDRYAIYGFSGMTRKRCSIYPIKRFEEHYNHTIKQRISGIKPQEYTRMGVTIRHLTHLLSQVDSQIKLLITLSDGRPDDEGDNYRGLYGIEDTRQALLEAQYEGIYPFCITIDTEAKTYLPRMYGNANYVVIDKVEQLPFKVADIYRRLTKS
ncbi:nitric oxide reductase activation protein [Candidatus Albibeggiatoa sp. nov. NOAA]|uniref:nitric oxide reductase activation protein NorD n=1 Tax=Candidatus Albibeggiatoa sp. nov. NOAA TaxID=3162724 RepID=UPI0033003899|nr:nitric oxide reductase activation protein [Thiotrichaceae bacterium]